MQKVEKYKLLCKIDYKIAKNVLTNKFGRKYERYISWDTTLYESRETKQGKRNEENQNTIITRIFH